VEHLFNDLLYAAQAVLNHVVKKAAGEHVNTPTTKTNMYGDVANALCSALLSLPRVGPVDILTRHSS
jgi:hypothetical protein